MHVRFLSIDLCESYLSVVIFRHSDTRDYTLGDMWTDLFYARQRKHPLQ